MAPGRGGVPDGGGPLSGARWPSGLGLATLVLLAACGRASTPEGVAQRFMDDYYVRADLGAAKGLAGGLATQKIDEQIELTRGQARGAAMEGRSVSYSLVSRQQDGDRHLFMYDVRIRAGSGGEFARRSVLSVGRIGGGWRVTNFREAGP